MREKRTIGGLLHKSRVPGYVYQVHKDYQRLLVVLRSYGVEPLVQGVRDFSLQSRAFFLLSASVSHSQENLIDICEQLAEMAEVVSGIICEHQSSRISEYGSYLKSAHTDSFSFGVIFKGGFFNYRKFGDKSHLALFLSFSFGRKARLWAFVARHLTGLGRSGQG